MRPDYVADPFGQDTYTAHVQAVDGKQAVITAQQAAYTEDTTINVDGASYRTDFGNPEDYYPVFVHAGHLQHDCSWES